MQSEISRFLAMGGFARYVWLAFGMTIFVLVLNVLLPFFRLRKLNQQARPATKNWEKTPHDSAP